MDFFSQTGHQTVHHPLFSTALRWHGICLTSADEVVDRKSSIKEKGKLKWNIQDWKGAEE
jgi:hypothetical protein